MFNVLVITDEEIGIGFRLTGVKVLEVSTASEAETLLRKCMTDDSFGMILINEDYLSHFDSKTNHLIEESTIPLVIPIPVRMKWEFEGGKSTYIDDIVRKAVGYQISLH